MGFWSLLKEQYYFLRQRYKFRKCHGYELDIENPRSYNEKIMWRKICDRNPLFPILSDKYRSREYVVERLGKEAGEKILVPLLFVTENPEDIPFDDLPEEYIIKPNHGSGWFIIVDRDHKVPREKIVSKCRKWMKKTYGQSKMEWAYSQVRPLIMVEKLLKDRHGILAPNYKFFVFQGKVSFMDLFFDHFRMQAFYDSDFSKLDVKRRDAKFAEARDISKPEGFGEMVSISEKIAADLDFIRVDLYSVEGRTYFGEFTIYPASGLGPYDPPDFDCYIGDKWHLDRGRARRFYSWF